MKQFLYLDTDIVNSIIAQSEKGLVTSTSNEKAVSDTEEVVSSATAGASTKIGGALLKLVQAEANITGQLESKENDTTAYTSREIVAKTLHDAAFDIASAKIPLNIISFGDQSYDETGNYVQLTRVFDFVDFDYLEGLFAENGVIEFVKKSAADEIEAKAEEVKGEANREQIRKNGNNLKAEVKKLIESSNKQYDDIARIIKVMRSMIPYSRMLLSNDGYLIPLSTKYFRVDHSDIGFKYGGEITCVGMITNVIGEDCDPCDGNNIFATLQHTSNELLRNLLPTKEKNLCVIHPIAIYYGN